MARIPRGQLLAVAENVRVGRSAMLRHSTPPSSFSCSLFFSLRLKRDDVSQTHGLSCFLDTVQIPGPVPKF